MELMGEMKNLAAQHAINKGNYARAKSFRESIRNMGDQTETAGRRKRRQERRHPSAKTRDAEKEWLRRRMTWPVSEIHRALKSTETMEYENRAIEELDKMFKKTRQFKYRQREGEIKISQFNRMERNLRQEFAKSLTQHEEEKGAGGVSNLQGQGRVGGIPTDRRELSDRYECPHSRLPSGCSICGNYTDVIPVLQQCRNDPKYRAPGGTLLGRAFLEAGFGDEAVDTIRGVIDDYPARGDDRYKGHDLLVWPCPGSEGNMETALKQYSLVAQMEFKYKDVQDRIKRFGRGMRAWSDPEIRKPKSETRMDGSCRTVARGAIGCSALRLRILVRAV